MSRTAIVQSWLAAFLYCVSRVAFADNSSEAKPADALQAVNVTNERAEFVRKELSLLVQRLEISLRWEEEVLQIKWDELCIFVEAAGTDDTAELDRAQQKLIELSGQRSREIEMIRTERGEIESKLTMSEVDRESEQQEREPSPSDVQSQNGEVKKKKFLERKREMLSRKEARLIEEVKGLEVQARKLEYRSMKINQLKDEVDSCHDSIFSTRQEIRRIQIDLGLADSN